MRCVGIYVFLLLIIVGNPSVGASLLQPQPFPGTVADLSFTQRVSLLTDGYEPWQAEYDASGRCISGCVYGGITIQDELQILENNTNVANANLTQYLNQIPHPQNQTNNTTQNNQNQLENLSGIIAQYTPRCRPNNPNTPANQEIPLGVPLVGTTHITSPYGARTHPVTGKPSVHRGIDFSAAVGTPVYSPAIGTVESVWTDNSCGNGLKISHSNGYETVYCHLDSVLAKQGDAVGAGCVVAKTGDSGITTGPHLHYAIKYNGEYINPTNWVNQN